MKKRVYLTYTTELVKEPFIYNVGKLFDVVTNIRTASISANVGIVALELEGESSEIDKALKYFTDNGVTVEPIELDVVE